MNKRAGFTIVELAIVIVVIGILATITAVAYTGVQERAYNVKVQANLKSVSEKIEIYESKHGSFPSTGGLDKALTDPECSWGDPTEQWVPDINTDSALPTSTDASATGVRDNGGCYIYASDGDDYVLSGWNMIMGVPQAKELYRRIGFRHIYDSPQKVICNGTYYGGTLGGTYDVGDDYYKSSFTISSIKSCNETPPAGA